MVTYSDSGVDIDLEEETVSHLISKLKDTLKFRDVITESGHFAALVRLGDKAIAMSTDGVGSKILVASMLGKYDTVGIDCIAMVVNDILCVGAEPIALVDYLAVEKPDPAVANQIGEGLAKGAEISKIAIIGGETASLPEIIKDFDLAGTGMGIVDEDKIITGAKIEEGDLLIGIESSGIHSNGLSLARRVFFEDSGLDVNDPLPGYPERTVGEELLMPTAIYVEPIMELLRSDVEVHGLAHITGGGFTNLKRLKKGTGYKIDYLPEPHPIFKSIYSFNVPLEEMYRVFNMGIGFVVILKGEDVDEALDIIRKYEKAHLIGQVMGDIEEKIEIHTFENKTLLL
ncbi:MAG: phosphoribosylformylglycinamidine cyclo-ligase [Euryarchaeota archaeon]|nr:phosphoribosylformylglycinamidine cyclo-ligase [Euryarchaeota archaeon]MBU4608893.1 phosphoribosylformylglycinamidine cyclo-ligase [Euryarchaeota archaeon]MBV1729634.1 phosphoribosylformylglycinamidine cyclo-ligase [Methanobacterium sp.]MBV1755500.1 phosphoribosylformylglycinamidine cyclo-ligase [Methanobacterium sp.]